ncbi:MAG: sugar phosphate isomerase/epimerase [Muribaculaceae bacterium]|nr:sugar phosphate isomerase/epimerase [Muribaculaceae bacterium]
MQLKGFAIIALLAAAATGCSGEKSVCCDAHQGDKEIGVQLYSVRKAIDEQVKNGGSIAPVLDSLASWGYTWVEAANYDYNEGKFYGMAPADYKAAVEAAGLKSLSSHTTLGMSDEEMKSGNFAEKLAMWDKLIADHKAAGIEYIVTPWSNVPGTLAELDNYVKYQNAIGHKCAEAGVKYGYHNHSHEFQKVEDQVMLEYMIQNTDPDSVFYEMDVYWTMRGAASPVELFKKYPNRFRLLHIKDHREVGQSGMVGYDAIFNNTDAAGTEGIVVEVEGSSYGDTTADLYRTMKESAEYLKKAPFVKESYWK